MKNISAEEQKEVENSIREHIWDVGFPMEYFIFNINDFSIDFMREFKDDIWWDEVFDMVLVQEDSNLMEFYKDYEKSL